MGMITRAHDGELHVKKSSWESRSASAKMEKEAIGEKVYAKSLEHFLALSGEDTVDIDSILEHIPSYAGPTLEALKSKGYGRVLDIGSGNGAKAIYLAHRLQDLGISVVVDSLEPKAEQRARLVKNYQGENRKFLGDVFGNTLRAIQISEKYDLVLAIHCLYEFPRNDEGETLSLDSLGDIISERGAGVIVIEHPESDFQSMKREIYPSIGKKNPVSQEIVVRSLETNRIPFTIGDKIDLRFYVNDIINERALKIGKIMSFLFSESLDDNPLTDNEYRAVGHWVENNVREDKEGHSYLWTPDVSIWTYSRQN